MTKYEVIFQTFSEQIQSGTLKPGSKLPDEDKIANDFGVSLITVRRAMTDLANAGLIKRIRGKGSYINRPTLAYDNIPRDKVIALMLNHGNYASVSITRILSGVQDTLSKSGYRLLVDWNVSSDSISQSSINRMLANRVEGFIIYPFDPAKDAGSYDYIKSMSVPYVLLDRYDFRHPNCYVGSNNISGGRLAARRLIEYGHTKAACCVNLFFLSSEQERYNGFAQEYANEDSSFTPLRINLSDGKTNLVQTIKDNDITALFCVSDRTAANAIKLLNAGGMRVPEDVSVIGFDDCLYDSEINFPISSVRQDFPGIGKAAAEKLLSLIASTEPQTNTQTLLEVELIDRPTSLKNLNA